MCSANVVVNAGLNLCSLHMFSISAGLEHCCLHVFSQCRDICWFESLLFTYVQSAWRQALVWINVVYLCSANVEEYVGLKLYS